MIISAMGGRWVKNRIQYSYLLILILVIAHGCSSLNLEGLALLDFYARVSHDPYGAFASWNIDDHDPCLWSHVQCVFGHVHALELKGLSLEGVLAPELGNLTHLRRLVLSHNRFSGVIPKELGKLKMLEILDLRDNNLTGKIPAEIGKLQSLNLLLLYNNDLEGNIPPHADNLNFMQFVQNFKFNVKNAIAFLHRKLGRCIWKVSFNPNRNEETVVIYLKLFQLFNKGILDNSSLDKEMVQDLHIDRNIINRKLVEHPANLVSKSFSAIRMEIKKLEDGDGPSSSDSDSGSSVQIHINIDMWLIMVGVSCGGFLLFTTIALLFMIRNPKSVKKMAPWKSGLSGQLQQAFVTGVQKLDLEELETACEDFSNIIDTIEGCVLFKGTLPNGVEICVASTTITTYKDWSRRAEFAFHKKIETLSRVNHKNFVNLIGYCEEDEPFVRMMVFEYAPNGTLSEHLHVQELEHVDWKSRIRIIMGVAYCLQCMHDLDPSVVHRHLDSNMIYLTDDYAAKVADLNFWKGFYPKAKMSLGANESSHSPHVDKETDIYSFGVLLLEIISGKHQNSDRLEPLVTWAEHFLKEKENISHIIDPSLKSFEQNELEIVCEVIQECIKRDGIQRPSINEVISKLREVIRVSPQQATPRLSPLWWAELELLSIKEETT